MKLTKKTALKSVLILYLIVSAIFILSVLSMEAKNRFYQYSFMNGRTYTIEEILQKATDGTCEPFTVYDETTTVELINTQCQSENSTQPTTP